MRRRGGQVLPAVGEVSDGADSASQLSMLLRKSAFEDGHGKEVEADDDGAKDAAEGHRHFLRHEAAEVAAFEAPDVTLVLEIVVAEPGKRSTINRSLYQQNLPFCK